MENVHKDNFNAEKKAKEFKEPKTKKGDIYHLGNHRLICGDSINIEYYKKILDGKKINLIVTDPPYNIDYGGTIYGGPIYVFHLTKETVNFINAMIGSDLKYAQTLVWYKNYFTLGRQDYQCIYEPILYGSKEGKLITLLMIEL